MKKDIRFDRKLFLGQTKGAGCLAKPDVDEDGEIAPRKESMLARYNRDWDSRTPQVSWAWVNRQIIGAIGENWDAFMSRMLHQCRRAHSKFFLREMLERRVETHTLMGDADIIEICPAYSDMGRVSIAEAGAEFYLHPLTRVLCRQNRQPQVAAPKPVTRVILSDEAQLHRVGGIWYRVKLADLPATTADSAWDCLWDCLLGRRVFAAGDNDCRNMYGRPGVYSTQKQQLSRKDLIQFNLAQSA